MSSTLYIGDATKSIKLDSRILDKYTRHTKGGEEVAFKIKELREKLQMTQAELAKKADVSRQKLIDLESGRDVNTTVATLQKLADALNCKVQDLICP